MQLICKAQRHHSQNLKLNSVAFGDLEIKLLKDRTALFFIMTGWSRQLRYTSTRPCDPPAVD